MVVEIPIIISIINQAREWLKMSDAKNDAEKAEIKNALKAVYTASIETRGYLARRECGGQREREIETALSKLWVEAAIELRTIDKSLAEILEMKSQYWSEPEKWSKGQIQESGIQIERVTELARELLLSA